MPHDVLSFLCLTWVQTAGCGVVQSGDFFEVSCTDNNGDPIPKAESIILNGETLGTILAVLSILLMCVLYICPLLSAADVGLPLQIPRSALVNGNNTIQVNFIFSGVTATATLLVQPTSMFP